MTSESDFYDYYKESFAEQKAFVAQRNKLTIWLFLILLVFGFQLENPQSLESIFNKVLENKQPGVTFGFEWVNVFMEFLFIWIVVSYYQANLAVERTYDYIHALEQKLSASGDYKIEREGEHYKNSYTLFHKIVHWFYVLALPLLVVTFSILKITHSAEYGFQLIQIILLSIVVIVSLLYLIQRCRSEFK